MTGRTACETLRDERGAATALALAIVGTLVGLAGGGVAVAGAFIAVQRAAGAADAAALAAAEVASGAVPGYPCSEGARLAEANGARLESCDLDGPIVTVTTSVPYLGSSAQARARAGPPGSNSPSSAGQRVCPNSAEKCLEVAVFDRAGPLVESVVGGELDAGGSDVEVTLGAGDGWNLQAGARDAGVEEFCGDGNPLKRAVDEFGGVRRR